MKTRRKRLKKLRVERITLSRSMHWTIGCKVQSRKDPQISGQWKSSHQRYRRRMPRVTIPLRLNSMDEEDNESIQFPSGVQQRRTLWMILMMWSTTRPMRRWCHLHRGGVAHCIIQRVVVAPKQSAKRRMIAFAIIASEEAFVGNANEILLANSRWTTDHTSFRHSMTGESGKIISRRTRRTRTIHFIVCTASSWVHEQSDAIIVKTRRLSARRAR